MKTNKASKLRFFWIAFMSGLVTLWACLRIILGSIFITNYRAFISVTLQSWSRRLLNLVKVNLKIVGCDFIPQAGRPIIVMCNHSSLYDIPISQIALQTDLRMLTKRELFKIPIFSSALKRGEFISIDRENRKNWKNDLALAKEKMLDGIILWVSPEGTRSKDGNLAKFKRGGFQLAIDTQALIIPIVIKNIHKVQAGKQMELYLNQEVEVEICSSIDTANYSPEERNKLIDDVRSKMLVALENASG